MIITDTQLPQATIYNILQDVQSRFTPPLSQSVDIKLYSIKLSKYAQFLLFKDGETLAGFTAYYRNSDAKQIYITSICVTEAYERKGIGSEMLDFLQQNHKNFESIALEVNKQNTTAKAFYDKHGFLQQEDRGKKLLMVKSLH